MTKNNILNNKITKVILFRICFIIAITTALVCGLKLNIINDGFWHIKVGEYIIKNRVIPREDIFSWYGIENKLKWISHEWLFGVIAYLVYKIKGFTSVIIFSTIVNCSTALLVYKFALIRNKNKVVSLIIMWVYIFGDFYDITYRPVLISKLILLCSFILLEKKKYLFALIVLILGVNIHGGIYPLYLMIFAYYTIPFSYKYLIFSLITVLINPYGYNLYKYTYLSMKNIDINRYINEWCITPIYDYKVALIIICITVCICTVSKIKFKDFLFCGALIILAISAKRHVDVIYLFVLPVISLYFNSFYFDFFMKFVSRIKPEKLKSIIPKLNYITCGFLIVVMIVKSSLCIKQYFFDTHFHNFEYITNDSENPIKACNFINSHQEIKNSRTFNDYNSSPYIIFRGIKTFVDSRQDLFTYNFNKTNAFVDQIKALNNYDYMIYVFKKYNIKYAILRNDMPNTRLLRNTDLIYIIYEDRDYSIFQINRNKLKSSNQRGV
ncbi:hypothetical protein BJV85_003019 [Clostridium acetobutylicum]|uniref:Probably membrane protein n=1 Tax=Clostridium acetobutylicum (strain ATCC 824 / DSM 792 / JCM 1419 / IAM 19013 / LMG 5710 / NBRC 13948 / NRRL B-527 / VKM B-1787 / 2291 / W) TaxID=272562 RepID=Q97KD1_CLOAB|nr:MULTISPECIES: hypothetical protein [Clostridium]AAK78964.1 Probably membrane protein [Clostridium acetobutylicum ATCC 824]ADZ20038.1 putative membrane protein [Clostridium acetobutylicum EA 2018]AEI31537.1 membrane protein [Clostridium acetobutylicum DSM 1731]AWV81779.1 hypothetical protein DK921_17125 [Clostridium acetobutylicum]MBC2395323.1 hypothetical protein [Clostridium acetobutylicum]